MISRVFLKLASRLGTFFKLASSIFLMDSSA
jgi:hypothetical protein